MSSIRIGTSSWAEPEFRKDWYPKSLKPAELLGWYSKHFDYVEVNSSWYAIPNAANVQKWVGATPRDFVFDVKLHKLLTRHAAPPETLPPDLRKMAEINGRGNAIITPDLEAAMIDRTLMEFAPLIDSGKFGAFLLQLSPSFSQRTAILEDLDPLLEALKFFTVAVELRNRSWVADGNAVRTIEFFKSRRVPMVVVDAPESEHFTVMPSMNDVTAPDLAYLRLHGRDEQFYIKGKTVATRFNYLYTEEELQQIAKRVLALAREAQHVHVAFNNNAEDFAPKAATRLRRILGQEPPPEPAPADRGDLF